LSFLLAYILAAGLLSADDTPTIITEGSVSIQFFSTADFTGWPGVSGFAPVDVSAEAGRVWLIWPGSIINLDTAGGADVQTLLTIFATRSASWGKDRWTPRSGIICSDGYWRGFVDLDFTQVDLFSGIVTVKKWDGDSPDSIYPASDGNLMIFSGNKAELADFNSGKMKLVSRIPPVSMLAVSTRAPLAAWWEGGSSSLHITDFDAETDRQVEIPPGIPWNMSWVGNLLVTAYSGKLYALNIQKSDKPEITLFEDERLPDRWYRIRGGEDYLLIQSPEEGTAAVLTMKSSGSPRRQNDDFPELLKKYTLDAGDELVKSGLLQQAGRYYSWVMPYIREFRSRYPLEEIWPNLESEITHRRSTLR